MATQVYLGGKGVIIAKNGGDTLNIPVQRANYTLLGFAPIVSIESYGTVQFMDLITEDTIIDKALDVVDASNSSVGSTILEVKNYLSSLGITGTTRTLVEEACTKANQETIIAQNEEIKEDLNQLNITQEDSQDILKKELQENNKLLRKIYN